MIANALQRFASEVRWAFWFTAFVTGMTANALKRFAPAVGWAFWLTAFGPSGTAAGNEPAPAVTTTVSVSAEILELAENLSVLEDLDLLVQWEVLELMPLLEDDDEP